MTAAAPSKREAPDLLIADLRLEGFNGLQLLHVNPRPIPAIIVTGYPDEVLQAEARKLGAEYLRETDRSLPVLLSTVERMLAGPDRQERRRWPRKRLLIDLPVEVDDVPGARDRHRLRRRAGGGVPAGRHAHSRRSCASCFR